MSRKDYCAIASAISASRPMEGEDSASGKAYLFALQTAAENIADILAKENERFDRGRFLKACGFPSQ